VIEKEDVPGTAVRTQLLVAELSVVSLRAGEYVAYQK
jgi:hypothetical protein